MTIVNILAILISPVIAVLVTVYLQDRREKRNQKLWIFHTLIGNRHIAIAPESIRALNMIDVVFHDCNQVRKIWHEYLDMLCNEGLNNAVGFSQRQKKNLEMITEMAKVLGYGGVITHLDVDRVYSPVGLGEQSKRSDDITAELLRVLKASGGVQFVPRKQGDDSSNVTPPVT
ncbi:MAG: DUF6680 family protein [Verrucomicrobiia bacterium]|jgi:hypothetical protein